MKIILCVWSCPCTYDNHINSEFAPEALKLVQSHHRWYKNEDLKEVMVIIKVERSSSPSIPSKCKILHFTMPSGWPNTQKKHLHVSFEPKQQGNWNLSQMNSKASLNETNICIKTTNTSVQTRRGKVLFSHVPYHAKINLTFTHGCTCSFQSHIANN